jgi:hypothetical protein
MHTPLRLALALVATLCALLSVGCGGSSTLTQVLLEVDTDIGSPATIDEIRATIRSPSGEARVASAVLGFGQPLPPRTLAITHGDDRLDGYEVDLDGLSRGVIVVSRRVVFDMTEGQIRRVVVSLDQACVGVPCAGATTCSAGACVAPNVQSVPLSSTGSSDAGSTSIDGGL